MTNRGGSLNMIIGSGIFMSPGAILSSVGSVGAYLLTWVACGGISFICALSYLELALLHKESAGEYVFILKAYSDFIGFLSLYCTVIILFPAGFLLRFLVSYV